MSSLNTFSIIHKKQIVSPAANKSKHFHPTPISPGKTALTRDLVVSAGTAITYRT
jgi:hypothetical protein